MVELSDSDVDKKFMYIKLLNFKDRKEYDYFKKVIKSMITANNNGVRLK